MPGISDPGYRVIAKAVEHGITVVPVPGASAFVAALAASGLPTDSFEFHGFLPPKSGQRRHVLESIKASQPTQVFYEAPHRVKEALGDIAEVLGGNRPVVIAREVSKIHEEFLRGKTGEILQNLESAPEIKGEITLLIGKAVRVEDDHAEAGDSPAVLPVAQRVAQLMQGENLDEKSALKKVAKERGISKSEAYRELQRTK
jgi:16S rRNA (cytidine1402-2'-O)-methyltransferase